ncbi:hypothetical protein EA473_12745 [Natrarchaeobius chitinivorans]|uniref:Uncharacterized protein n=1 Tax=Natrarchaeobius chitinivorans TaxID=1679083 RepID=A0A3N6LV60_NATCH|nr:hypothetical protein EA473_12745 [Natrarchaeobius chitinivorans]
MEFAVYVLFRSDPRNAIGTGCVPIRPLLSARSVGDISDPSKSAATVGNGIPECVPRFGSSDIGSKNYASAR